MQAEFLALTTTGIRNFPTSNPEPQTKELIR
jgi:hypothetical protein